MDTTAYKKVVDADGNIIALTWYKPEGSIVLLQPVAATNRQGFEVNISEVHNEEELQSKIGGSVFDCPPEEYNDTLFTTWGFDGSNVYRAEDTVKGETDEQNSQGLDGQGTDGQGQPEPDGTGDTNDGSASDTTSADQPGTIAGSELSADANAQSEGSGGSVNDGNVGVTNTDVGAPIVTEQSGESAGTSNDEPNADAGRSDGDIGTGADATGTDGSDEEKAA